MLTAFTVMLWKPQRKLEKKKQKVDKNRSWRRCQKSLTSCLFESYASYMTFSDHRVKWIVLSVEYNAKDVWKPRQLLFSSKFSFFPLSRLVAFVVWDALYQIVSDGVKRSDLETVETEEIKWQHDHFTRIPRVLTHSRILHWQLQTSELGCPFYYHKEKKNPKHSG